MPLFIEKPRDYLSGLLFFDKRCILSVMERAVKTEEYGLARYFLLTVLLSLLGWVFETVWMRIATGQFIRRGFLSLPLCPIYGCSLLIVYALVGTPKQGGWLLNRITKSKTRYILYALCTFLIPSVMELLVGVFFYRAFHLRLWDYSYKRLQIGGFVCLRNSFVWSALIFLFMQYAFTPIQKAIGRLPNKASKWLGLLLFALILADFSLQIALTIYK